MAGFYSFIDSKRAITFFWRNCVITKCAAFHLKIEETIGSPPSTCCHRITFDPSLNDFLIVSPYQPLIGETIENHFYGVSIIYWSLQIYSICCKFLSTAQALINRKIHIIVFFLRFMFNFNLFPVFQSYMFTLCDFHRHLFIYYSHLILIHLHCYPHGFPFICTPIMLFDYFHFSIL
jgi:hypothetical protein